MTLPHQEEKRGRGQKLDHADQTDAEMRARGRGPGCVRENEGYGDDLVRNLQFNTLGIQTEIRTGCTV